MVGVRAASQVIPALAAGNAVVLVATGAAELAERLDHAELPSGVFNLVDGGELTPHPGIDLLRSPPGAPVTIRLDEVDDDEALRLAGFRRPRRTVRRRPRPRAPHRPRARS